MDKKIWIGIAIVIVLAWIYIAFAHAGSAEDLAKINSDMRNIQNRIAQAQKAIENDQIIFYRLQGAKMYIEAEMAKKAWDEAIKAESEEKVAEVPKDTPEVKPAPKEG